MKKWPFFIIIDDGGFPYVSLVRRREKIIINHYLNILKLAKEFGIRIPICFTLRFLDLLGISKIAEPLSYLNELLALIKENTKYIEFCYHGLTHEYNGKLVEFYDIYDNKKVPKIDQEKNIEISFQIINSLSLPIPKIFVPPSHAWEPGVTDKILSNYGIRYIVSFPKIEVGRFKYNFHISNYLEFLPRKSLGIYNIHTNLNSGIVKKTLIGRIRINNQLLRLLIYPRPFIVEFLFEKKMVQKPFHSYMTHIGNFSSNSMDFWRKIFEYANKREDVCLCRDFEEAYKAYKLITRK